jgi:hypothetical protein
MAAALGILGLGQVAVAGVVEQDFASASDLEPLGYGLFRFDAFGSSHKSLLQKSANYTWQQALKQVPFLNLKSGKAAP